jgi:hypothetical protein
MEPGRLPSEAQNTSPVFSVVYLRRKWWMFPLELVGLLAGVGDEFTTGWSVQISASGRSYRVRTIFSTEAGARAVAGQIEREVGITWTDDSAIDRRFKRIRSI